MRLVYCIPSLENSGGTERTLIQRVNYLVRKVGYEIYIITTDQNSDKIFFELDSAVHVIHLNINFVSIENLPLWEKIMAFKSKQQLYRKKLEQLLLSIRPDITTSLLSHEIDFLTNLKDGSYKIGENHFNKKFRYDFVRTKNSGWLKKGIAYCRYLQLVCAVKKLDCFISLTQLESDSWHGVKLKKIIPNFLYSFPSSYSSCENHEVIAVGRYAKEKGFDLLLKAWCTISVKYPDWHLSVYGDGDCRHDLEKFVKDNKLNNVDLYYPVHDIYEAYIHSAIAVVPSRFEGFGMVIIEAMACGVPVVAFDCKNGPAEIIIDGENGILVKSEDVNQLAKNIIGLMEDHDRRIVMGKKAINNTKRFSAEKIMKEWMDFYNEVMTLR